VTPQGRLLPPDELPASVPADLAGRVLCDNGRTSFLLASPTETDGGRPIVLTDVDGDAPGDDDVRAMALWAVAPTSAPVGADVTSGDGVDPSPGVAAAELVRAFSDRLDRIGPEYNALALSLRADGLKQARATDDRIKHGRLRGPLEGIPYGAKDLLAVQDRVATWGARPFATRALQRAASGE